jgi:adenylyltransferase/sulfurtransferase
MRADVLTAAPALVVGVGGLGCAAAPVLADAGVALTLCDFDRVEERNLARQPLYRRDDIGTLKVECAADALVAAHPGLDVTLVPLPFDAALVDDAHVVLDCTDDPATRALVHESCVRAGVPLAWGAVDGAHGQHALVVPGGPCLRCLWPDVGAARPCGVDTDAGVMRRVGVLQAEAALDALAGGGQAGVLSWFDGADGSVGTVRFARRPDCATCGPNLT